MSEMKNGEGVCSWRDWHESMNEEQRQYEIHRCLTLLHSRTKSIEGSMASSATVNKKYAFAGGVVGGFAAVLMIYGIEFVSKI